jgi:hypothetical protein
MIGAAICTFAIGICQWKFCHRTKEDLTPRPSAPPMPMQVIAPQPAVAPWTAPISNQKPANNNRAARSNNAILINITITQEASRSDQRRTPKKGRDIGNNIFVNSVNI